MTGRILPNTNAFIALMRGDVRVLQTFGEASGVILAAAVLGELRYGAMNSASPQANLVKLQRLQDECDFAPVDEDVVNHYAQVRLGLKRKGRPIPENDIWIAATVISLGTTLLTDDAHFNEVEGLAIERFSSR